MLSVAIPVSKRCKSRQLSLHCFSYFPLFSVIVMVTSAFSAGSSSCDSHFPVELSIHLIPFKILNLTLGLLEGGMLSVAVPIGKFITFIIFSNHSLKTYNLVSTSNTVVNTPSGISVTGSMQWGKERHLPCEVL